MGRGADFLCTIRIPAVPAFADLLLDPEKELSLPHYFKRRIFRILPAYYVQIAILILLASLGLYGTLPGTSELLTHIVMIHNFWPSWNGSINGVYWTLPIEFSFYLVLPVVFLTIRKIGWAGFTLSLILLVLSYKFTVHYFTLGQPVAYRVWIFGQLAGKMDLFACGIYAAFLYKKYHLVISTLRYKHMLEWGLIIAGLTGINIMIFFMQKIGGVYWNGHWSLFVWDATTGVMIMLLILGITLNGRLTRMVFANKFILFIGTISYSIYLWHLIIIKMFLDNATVTHYLSANTPLISVGSLLLAIAPITLIIAILSYFYVEEPSMKLGAQQIRLPLLPWKTVRL
jgi:peptidoglycan/LPS O-acetylase OafA/YrhL